MPRSPHAPFLKSARLIRMEGHPVPQDWGTSIRGDVSFRWFFHLHLLMARGHRRGLVSCMAMNCTCRDAGSTDYYYRLQGAGSFRSVTAAVKHLLSAEGRAPQPSASAPASAVPAAAVATPANGWQLPQQPERRTSSPPRPASPEPAAPGSPGSQPAAAGARRAAPASPKRPNLANALGAGAGVNAAPRKSNSGGVSVPVSLLLPGEDFSKGDRSGAAASAAAQPARTKAALAALGRDSPMPADALDAGMPNGAGVNAGRGTAATGSYEPGPSEEATDGAVSAAEEGNAAGEIGAAQDMSGARKRRRSECPRNIISLCPMLLGDGASWMSLKAQMGTPIERRGRQAVSSPSCDIICHIDSSAYSFCVHHIAQAHSCLDIGQTGCFDAVQSQT